MIPKLLETEALRRLRIASKPTVEKEITEFLRNMFIEFVEPEIKLTLENIKERTVKKRYEDTYINKILTENMRVRRSDKTERYKIPYWETDPLDEENIKKTYHAQRPGRPFTFRIEDFLTQEEMNKIGFLPSPVGEGQGVRSAEKKETNLPF